MVTVSPVGSVKIQESAFLDNNTAIRLECSTGGGPGNNFTWFSGNTTLTTTDQSFDIITSGDTSQTVQISNLISGSLVMFTCLVENQAGQENVTINIQGMI